MPEEIQYQPDALDVAQANAASAERQQKNLNPFDQLEAIKFWTKDDVKTQWAKPTSPFWAFNEELILANLKDSDLRRIQNSISIMANWVIMSMPAYKVDAQFMNQIENVKSRMNQVRATRAIDGRERTLQATSINIMERSVNVKKKGGVISRVASKLIPFKRQGGA
jgi:hypothetical protein